MQKIVDEAGWKTLFGKLRNVIQYSTFSMDCGTCTCRWIEKMVWTSFCHKHAEMRKGPVDNNESGFPRSSLFTCKINKPWF